MDVDAAEPDFEIVVRVDADLAEVGRTRVCIAEASPSFAFVFGAVDAPTSGMLHFGVDDVGIFAVDVDGTTADFAGFREAMRELAPMGAAINGTVKTVLEAADKRQRRECWGFEDRWRCRKRRCLG